MRNIMRAIARLLGFKTQRTEVPVLQTQTVGPVLLGRTHRSGNQPSVQATKPPRQSSPAQPRSQKKPKPAQQTTQASKGTSKKQKPVATAKSQTTAGSSTPTPASKTRQHAKQTAKPKR
jgi:hypothetical protein